MIEDIRKQIDDTDIELIELLAKRMELSRQVGEAQRQTGEDIHMRTREMEVLNLSKIKGNSLGFSDEFITSLYQPILAEARKAQG